MPTIRDPSRRLRRVKRHGPHRRRYPRRFRPRMPARDRGVSDHHQRVAAIRDMAASQTCRGQQAEREPFAITGLTTQSTISPGGRISLLASLFRSLHQNSVSLSTIVARPWAYSTGFQWGITSSCEIPMSAMCLASTTESDLDIKHRTGTNGRLADGIVAASFRFAAYAQHLLLWAMSSGLLAKRLQASA